MKTQAGNIQLLAAQRTREVLQALARRAQREAQAAAQQLATDAGEQIDQFFNGLLAELNSDVKEAANE